MSPQKNKISIPKCVQNEYEEVSQYVIGTSLILLKNDTRKTVLLVLVSQRKCRRLMSTKRCTIFHCALILELFRGTALRAEEREQIVLLLKYALHMFTIRLDFHEKKLYLLFVKIIKIFLIHIIFQQKLKMFMSAISTYLY